VAWVLAPWGLAACWHYPRCRCTAPRWPQESGEKWTAASEVQLCYEVKTFLLAGHETSSAMLCWTMYELSQSSEALAKVRACVGVGVKVCVWGGGPAVWLWRRGRPVA
jgi:hypothetical protein